MWWSMWWIYLVVLFMKHNSDQSNHYFPQQRFCSHTVRTHTSVAVFPASRTCCTAVTVTWDRACVVVRRHVLLQGGILPLSKVLPQTSQTRRAWSRSLGCWLLMAHQPPATSEWIWAKTPCRSTGTPPRWTGRSSPLCAGLVWLVWDCLTCCWNWVKLRDSVKHTHNMYYTWQWGV